MVFRKLIPIFFAAICLFLFFQNCGSQYQSSNASLNSSSEPIAYVLPSQTTPIVENYKLNWNLTESKDFAAAASNLRNQCESRRADFELTKKIVPVVLDEGLLPGDPLLLEMANVKSSFDKAYNVAFCAYFAKNQEERNKALTSIVNFVVEWSNTYVGDGNPVNDRFFIKFFTFVDLIFPLLNQEQIAAIRLMAQRLDQKEITFISTFNANDSRLRNNWKLRHLLIRIHANLILNNSMQIQALQTALEQQINMQFTAPTGFVLSTCPQLSGVGAYGSFDLQERGSLTSHLTGIAELVPLMVLKPDLLNDATKAKVLAAIELVRPYVLGSKSFIEFTCSRIPYDAQRIALDPNIASAWDPQAFRVLFRHSRLLWDSAEPWTERFITNDYAPWFKVFYTGKGDILTLPTN